MLTFITDENQEKYKNKTYYYFLLLLSFNYYVLIFIFFLKFALNWKARRNSNPSEEDKNSFFIYNYFHDMGYFLLALRYLKTLFSVNYKSKMQVLVQKTVFIELFWLFLCATVSLQKFNNGEKLKKKIHVWFLQGERTVLHYFAKQNLHHN